MMDGMEGLEGDFLNNREEMLNHIEGLGFSDIKDVITDSFLGSVVIDPREERMYFSDEMQKVLGNAAKQDMLLLTFLQFVPEHIRTEISNQYHSFIRDMALGEREYFTIEHPIMKGDMTEYDIEVRLKVLGGDVTTRVIGGLVFDRTRSVDEIAYDQLICSSTNAYLFTYDLLEDRCYLSNKFVEDFDLMGPVINRFSQECSNYLQTDDIVLLRRALGTFLDTHEPVQDMIIRLLTPSRGELYLRLGGFSDADRYGNLGGDRRYVSGECVDVTEYIQSESLRENLIDGSSAITFYADITEGSIFFSQNIRDIYPEARTEFSGDIVEELASLVIPEDKKRFRNDMHRVVNEPNSKFAIEIRLALKNNRTVWIACRGKSYYDTAKQSVIVVGTVFDLTQMNEVREIVEKNAACHELTGLPLREKLLHDAGRLLRDPNLLSAALVLLDLNDFKSFNDRYGRSIGNELLISMATMLAKDLPKGALLYHIGTDTFAILWPHASQIKVTEFMNNLQERGTQPIEINGGEYFVNFSVSAAFYPLSSNVDELLINAEIALHKVKQNKKMKYAIYSPVDKNELKERLDFELQITQCIRNNMENFQMYYQPLIDAKTGQLNGAEALLRWQSSKGELVNPEKVVTALENTDQMGAVSEWILDQAISQCAAWIAQGAPSDFYVHINATADDLIRKHYAEHVTEVLNNYRLKPENILIEITETSLVKNMAVCRKNLHELQDANIRTALDDFGSGYSSFNYLKELPVDEIKIDKSFVDDMDTVEFNRSFISAITMLAHSIGKKVVVEGIETESQVEAIRNMGADIFQGYFFGKPMSVFSFSNKYFS